MTENKELVIVKSKQKNRAKLNGFTKILVPQEKELTLGGEQATIILNLSAILK